jgi:hypothetical protein
MCHFLPRRLCMIIRKAAGQAVTHEEPLTIQKVKNETNMIFFANSVC